MRSEKLHIAIAATAMVLAIELRSAEAQHAMPPAGAGGPPAHMLAEMCATAFEKNGDSGRGFGMAFVADQNGYPGPPHTARRTVVAEVEKARSGVRLVHLVFHLKTRCQRSMK